MKASASAWAYAHAATGTRCGKKILSLLLSLMVCLTLLPTAVMAEESGSTGAEAAVAEVTINGGTPESCSTLQAAFEKVKNCTEADNATIKLLANVTLDDTLTIDSGSFTFDLSDHILRSDSYSPTVRIAGTADITLTGTAGKTSTGGSVWQGGIQNYGASYAVEVTGGKLTIAADQEVQIEGLTNASQMGARLFSSSANTASSARALYVRGGEVVVNGGFFDCRNLTAIEVRGGKLTFHNGRIGWYDVSNSNDSYPWISNYSATAIAVWDNGEVLIDGGEFTASSAALSVHSDTSNVTLTGGSFTKITVSDGRVDDLLGGGYGYKENTDDGAWIGWAICASESVENVKVTYGATLDKVTVAPDATSLAVGYGNNLPLSVTTTSVIEQVDPDNTTYQWYHISGNGNGYELIDSQTSSTYTFPTGKSLGEYGFFCVATRGGYSRRSNISAVTVAKNPAPTLTAPTIEQDWNDTAEKTVTPQWSGVPADAVNKKFSIDNVLLPAGISMGNAEQPIEPDTGTLHYTLTGATKALVGQEIVVKVKFTSDNYEDAYVDLKIKLTGATQSGGGNYYYRKPDTSGTEGKKPSATTGDVGILAYGLTALGSYTGTALMLRRKKHED